MIKVRVPASCGNIGSGFDCCGLAVSLYNCIEAELDDNCTGISITIEGEGQGSLPVDGNNLVYRSMQEIFTRCGKTIKGLRLRLLNGIPLSRGLGSSGTAILGGMYLANELLGRPFKFEEILYFAGKQEGHFDNIVSSALGGFTLSFPESDRLIYRRIKVDSHLKPVLAVPDFELSTAEARKILPEKVSMNDCIFNLSRAAGLVYAFSSNDFELLKQATEDRLHQPYRQKLIPGFQEIKRTLLERYGCATVISGAGPSVLALARNGNSKDVGSLMKDIFNKNHIRCNIMILDIDNRGIINYE